VEDFFGDFRHTIEAAEKELLDISEAESEAQPAPDQWSPKEVLGHLIDSAANNHYRKLGYKPFRSQKITDKVTLTFLEKHTRP
jgi:hypothetical protein